MFNLSHGQFDDLLALLYAHEIVVQEIYVEPCLQHARQNLRPAVEIVYVVPVDPIQDVEEPVEAKSSHIMRGNVLDQSDLVKHHYLRDKGYRFQPETVAPHEFPGGPSTIDDQSQNEGGR